MGVMDKSNGVIQFVGAAGLVIVLHGLMDRPVCQYQSVSPDAAAETEDERPPIDVCALASGGMVMAVAIVTGTARQQGSARLYSSALGFPFALSLN